MRTGPNAGRWAGHPEPVELTCAICGSSFKVRWARRLTAKYCCWRCHQVGEGRKGGVVRGMQAKANSMGIAYTKINGRHAHRVIAEQMIGRPLEQGEVVHHRDGDILNNDPSNLEVLPSQAEHMERHRNEMLAARKAKHGY